MQQRFARKGLVVWFVGVGEDPDDLHRFARELNLRSPVLLDPDGEAVAAFLPAVVRRSLAPGQLPVALNVLVDADGRIRYLALRDQPGFDPELREVARLLAAMPDWPQQPMDAAP